MANKSRIRKSKKRVSRKRNTRRNKKTGGGETVDAIITDVANFRTLTFSENKIESMQTKFNEWLTTFKAHISRISNVHELESLLTKIDSIRHSGSKGNNIFELARLETIIDNRIIKINCGKINSATDYETAREYYFNCHGYYPK
jgi:hypothetical protein